jgi:hypothetical protein
MRAYIDLMETAGLANVTAEKVIAYSRDPANGDVHDCYKEQIGWTEGGIEHMFGGNRDALDQWLVSMTGDAKAHVAAYARQEIMYRGFRETEKPREPLGVHWTVNPDMAEQFANGGPILEAYIDHSTIDWLGSVVRGIFWDFHREDELCLIAGSEIRLTNGGTAIV